MDKKFTPKNVEAGSFDKSRIMPELSEPPLETIKGILKFKKQTDIPDLKSE